MALSSNRPTLIINNIIGDPIQSLTINQNGCMVGSSLGRILFYPFLPGETQLSIPSTSTNQIGAKDASFHKNSDTLSKPSSLSSPLSSPACSTIFGSQHIISNPNSTEYAYEHSLAKISTLAHTYNNKSSFLSELYQPKYAYEYNIIFNFGLSDSQFNTPRAFRMLCNRTDLPVKFVHLIDNLAYAILENSQYFKWNLSDMKHEVVSLRDWTILSYSKELLKSGNSILIATTRKSVKIDLKNGTEKNVDFSIFDPNLIPLDYNEESILCLIRCSKKYFCLIIRKIGILEASRNINDHPQSKDHIKVEITKKPFITTCCFWAPSRFILVLNSYIIRVYKYSEDEIQGYTIHKGHKQDIVAIDSSHPDYFLSISKDKTLKAWTDKKKNYFFSMSIKPATFNTGWAYHIKHFEKKVIFSADQGVYLADLVLPSIPNT